MMLLIAGGFGAQGLSACAALAHFPITRVRFVLTGLPAFYAVSSKCLGNEEAFHRTLIVLKRFANYFEAIGSVGKTPSVLERVKYCYRWNRRIALYDWNDVEDILPPSVEIEGIACEVMDIKEMKIKTLTGDARTMAMGALSFPGLFPPARSRYVNTTYFSQIPLSTLEDDAVVLWNIMRPKLKSPSMDILLFSAMLWRAEELAHQKLRKFRVRMVDLPPVTSTDIHDPRGLLEKVRLILKNDGGF